MPDANLLTVDTATMGYALTPGKHYVAVYKANLDGTVTTQLVELPTESLIALDSNGAIVTVPLADLKKIS